MDIQANFAFPNHITAYGVNWVDINGTRHSNSFILHPVKGYMPWAYPCFNELNEQAFIELLEYKADIVIFGSGSKQKFPKPQWIRPLVQQQTGIESMDLYAACRTYNILASEGRNIVLAALIGACPPPLFHGYQKR